VFCWNLDIRLQLWGGLFAPHKQDREIWPAPSKGKHAPPFILRNCAGEDERQRLPNASIAKQVEFLKLLRRMDRSGICQVIMATMRRC
jgi:hypothetical protein